MFRNNKEHCRHSPLRAQEGTTKGIVGRPVKCPLLIYTLGEAEVEEKEHLIPYMWI